jgi:GNAT superfamily N-acetyltransferase
MDEGRRLCAEAVRSQPGFVATDDDVVIGFVTWERRFEEAAEITWMAVRRDRRGSGVGHALVDRLVDELLALGLRLLVALTVSPNDPDEPDARDGGYEATRAFYRSVGFVLARDLPREWGSDTAVLLVKTLSP